MRCTGKLLKIGLDILPTNLSFVQKVGFGDPICPLCHVEEESLTYLFFQCTVSRAVWFGQGMGLYTDCLPIHCCADIVNMAVNPHDYVGDLIRGK